MPGINEIVHPTQFRSSHHKAATNLAYTAFWLLESQKKIILHYDLTWTEFSLLSILRERFPYSMQSTKFKSHIPYIAFGIQGTTNKLITKKLIQHNLRAPNKNDRGFCINKDGLRLLTRIDQKIFHLDKIMAGISASEAEELSLLLDKARH